MNKLIALLLTAFSSNVFSTDPTDAYEMAKKGEAVIIDVREEDEVKTGMIKDAKWFPLSKVEKNQAWKEEFNKITDGKKIFLHCRSGVRSEKVLNILKKNGIISENIGGYETLKHGLPLKDIEIE